MPPRQKTVEVLMQSGEERKGEEKHGEEQLHAPIDNCVAARRPRATPTVEVDFGIIGNETGTTRYVPKSGLYSLVRMSGSTMSLVNTAPVALPRCDAVLSALYSLGNTV